MSGKQKAGTVTNWRICEPPKDSSCYFSNLAKCYQEKNCRPRILGGTKVSFKNEGEINEKTTKSFSMSGLIRKEISLDK